MTYPWIEFYANKIGVEIFVISDRKFPGFPPVYEKLQIYKLSKKMKNDWNIYIDSDTLIHPETIDFTNYIKKILFYITDMIWQMFGGNIGTLVK